jgi:hypothetical protein
MDRESDLLLAARRVAQARRAVVRQRQRILMLEEIRRLGVLIRPGRKRYDERHDVGIAPSDSCSDPLVSAQAAQQFAPLDTARFSITATHVFTSDESRAFVMNAHETIVRFDFTVPLRSLLTPVFRSLLKLRCRRVLRSAQRQGHAIAAHGVA